MVWRRVCKATFTSDNFSSNNSIEPKFFNRRKVYLKMEKFSITEVVHGMLLIYSINLPIRSINSLIAIFVSFTSTTL